MARAQKQNLHFTQQTIGSICLREAPMAICLLFSFVLLIMDATNSQSLSNAKMALQNSFAPIFSYTAKFSNTVDDFFLNFNTVSALNKEKASLMRENASMQMWRNQALRLEAENKSLKELLKFEDLDDYEYISARIAIDNSSGFNRNVVIDKFDLEKNQSIVSSHGLVGRVLDSDSSYSNVLLITDASSKVPATIERTRVKAIATGRNTNELDLVYLPENADITLGDRLVTSGDAGVYLPGLLVGTVSYIDGNSVRVKPATDFDKLEFISVLKEEN